MMLSFDIETQGLNTKRFILGCIVTDTGLKETFYTKQKLWHRILELGELEAKKGHNLVCYAHNLSYDLYGVIDWNLHGITIYSKSPLIVDYKNIKFIDTMSLYKGKLEDLGRLIGRPKAITPQWLTLDAYTPSDVELWDAARYCMQDCDVLLTGVQQLKLRLRDDGINVRTLITIGQCAINGYITYLQHREEARTYFKRGNNDYGVSYYKQGVFPDTINKEKIHAAFKGARVEAFQRGDHIAHMADVNSMYPYIMSTMAYPDLHTENHTPGEMIPREEYDAVLHSTPIGIAKAHVRLGNDDTIGSLAVRTEKGEFFPRHGEHIIGTWTFGELLEAQRRGATINHLFWVITWQPTKKNPLADYIETLYAKKRDATTEYDRWFYKQLMNHLYGKFGQRRDNTTYETGSIDETDQRLSTGWEIFLAIDATTNIYYRKEQGKQTKKFYAPIISTLITAGARIHLNNLIERIDVSNVVYCDTDGIIWVGNVDDFKYTDELGGLKLVHQNALVTIINKKTYRIDDEMHASGIPKNALTNNAFTGGNVTYKRMVTVFDTKDINDVGTFIEQTKHIEETDDTPEESSIYIDINELNEETITYLDTIILEE